MEQSRIGDMLGFQFAQAARKMQKTYESTFHPFGLTPSQALVLDQLWREDGLPLKELGARAHLDPTSVNWLVGQLERANLAERRKDLADRRVIRLWLTPAGRALEGPLYAEVRRQEQALEGVLLRYIAMTEVHALRTGMQVLVQELPEGEDLLAAVIAEWEARMNRLRVLVEDPEQAKGEGEA